MTSQRKPYDFVKRGLDIVGSGLAMVILSPVIGVVGLAVRARLGSPVIFKQERPGLDGKIFELYKFRSMLDIDETRGILTNEQRMTSFGRKIRSLSLDELPSLANVFRGDMSVVGPRPLRVEYLKHYSPRQARRHEVRPGITGLAQVKGRNSLTWKDRFEFDVQYVETQSPLTDLRILFATLGQVFRRSDIEGDGMAAMSAFVGNEPEDELIEEQLNEDWLETRVKLLSDPNIREGISITFTPNLRDTRKWFSLIKDNRLRRDWVYLNKDDQPVAMAGLTDVGSPDLYLYIYVDPEHQGKGYGSMVMKRLIYRARTFGAYRLNLEVKKSNETAIGMYERLGFLRIDTIDYSESSKYVYSIQLKD